MASRARGVEKRAARVAGALSFMLAAYLHEISTGLLPPRKVRWRCHRRRRVERDYVFAKLRTRDTTAFTLIHAIVTLCTRWIRWIASGEAICNTEAIRDIMAPSSVANPVMLLLIVVSVGSAPSSPCTLSRGRNNAIRSGGP